MQGIGNILKDKAQKQNKNLHSEIHYWADTISTAFGERQKFAMYLGVIKRIGAKEASRIYSEIKQSHCDNPGKLFIWKSKEAQVDKQPKK